MSICIPCTKANLIPLCVSEVVLGDVPTVAGQPFFIYQKHIGTGKIVRYDKPSQLSNTVDFSPDNLMANQDYEYWVTLQSGGLEDRENIDINGTNYECVTIEYTGVFDSLDGTSETYASITVEI